MQLISLVVLLTTLNCSCKTIAKTSFAHFDYSFGIQRHAIYHQKSLGNALLVVYFTTPNSYYCSRSKKMNFLQLICNCNLGWSKEALLILVVVFLVKVFYSVFPLLPYSFLQLTCHWTQSLNYPAIVKLAQGCCTTLYSTTMYPKPQPTPKAKTCIEYHMSHQSSYASKLHLQLYNIENQSS